MSHLPALDQIAESFGTAKHRLAWPSNLGWRVPQDVKLGVRGEPVSRALKRRAALPHDLGRDGQRIVWISPIRVIRSITPPDLGLDMAVCTLTSNLEATINARTFLRLGVSRMLSPAVNFLADTSPLFGS